MKRQWIVIARPALWALSAEGLQLWSDGAACVVSRHWFKFNADRVSARLNRDALRDQTLVRFGTLHYNDVPSREGRALATQ